MRSLILHTAIADALGECSQLLAQSLKAVLIEAVGRWMVPLRNSLDHFGARMVLVVVVDNNAAIQCDLSMLLFGISGSLWGLNSIGSVHQQWDASDLQSSPFKRDKRLFVVSDPACTPESGCLIVWQLWSWRGRGPEIWVFGISWRWWWYWSCWCWELVIHNDVEEDDPRFNFDVDDDVAIDDAVDVENVWYTMIRRKTVRGFETAKA